MKPLPIFGVGVSSYSTNVTAQRRLNCYYDLRPDQDSAPIVVRGTPGYFVWVELPTAPVRGWMVDGSTMYVVAGSVFYSITPGGVFTARGTLLTNTGYVHLASNGIQICVVDGLKLYIHRLSDQQFFIVNDASLPPGATHVVFLDSKFIINKPNTREIHISATLDGFTWTPEIFATKESSSDLLLAVDATSDYMVLFGQQSLEFWGNAGTSPNPFIRINGATQPWGVAAVNSIAHLGKSLIFLGQNKEGGVQVLHLAGYAPVRVSNTDIENLFSGFSVYSDAVALTYMVDGHSMYQLTFPSASRSFLYDDSTKMWSEVQTGLALRARHAGNLGIAFNSKNYISDVSSGNIYQLDNNSYTDNGTSIKRIVTSRHLQSDGNEFSLAEVELGMETGVGLQKGQGADPKISMQISRDGGATFGPERWRSIGKVGQYRLPRVRWDRCGSAYDMVLQFTMTDPVKFIITEAYGTVR